jgi:hypothetical protein
MLLEKEISYPDIVQNDSKEYLWLATHAYR